MIDIRQSREYANYLRRGSWIVERIKETNYFIRKFPLIGSVLKLQRPEKINFGTIDKLCRKYRVFQIIIEPDLGVSVPASFKLSKSPYLPSKTLQIDLTQGKEKIFRNLKKDARAAVRRGEANNIKVYSTSNEIKLWRKVWRNSVGFRKFVPGESQLINLRKSFPQNYSTFLTSHNISGSIIGGALFTRSSHNFAYYWYGFTNSEGRASLSQYSLLWHGILWAKKMDCKIFDFEGIYDSRFPNKSWLGFTHFKKSFGGTEILYPGCYTKFRLPL
jgi:hypothetical protein